MNCNELRKDIDELKSSYATLQEGYNHMNNELSGKADFRKNYSKTEQLSDKTLEKYLSDFAEKNPEFGSWHINKEIETFKNKSNLPVRSISDIKMASSGSVVVLGRSEYGGDQIFEYSFDEDGNPILIKESNPVSAPPLDTIFPLSDGTILATAPHGVFIYQNNQETKHENDKITELYGSIVKGSEDLQFAHGEYAACQLSDDLILVGEYGINEIRREKNKDGTYGEWKIKPILYGGEETVVEKMPDGAALIGGHGFVQEYRKINGENWKLGERKYEIFDADGYDMQVRKIIQLSDEKMLIVGSHDPSGPIYEYNKNPETGEWEIGADIIVPKESLWDFRADVQKISDSEILVYGCRYKKSQDDDRWKLIEGDNIHKEFFERCNDYPRYTVQASSQKIILHGYRFQHQDNRLLYTEPATFEVSRKLSSVDGLKEQLDAIIAKGEA